MSFESTVKDWIAIDAEMHELAEKMHQLRARKNALDKQIVEYSEGRNAKIFKYGDVKMRVVNTNTAESLTFKYLEKCLSEMVKNETQVKQMVDYIKRTRNIKQSVRVERI